MEFAGGSLAAWSHAATLLAFALFYVHLATPQAWSFSRQSPSTAILVYVVLTAFWAASVAAGVIVVSPGLLQLANGLDVLRYAAVIAFIFRLLRSDEMSPRLKGLAPLCVIALSLWFFLGPTCFPNPEVLGRFAPLGLFAALASIVLALVLLEQLFRNVAPDALWNIKPLVLAFSSTFIFDFYHFSEAILFKQANADTFGVRGLVYLISMPLLAMASARGRGWGAKVQLSQKAAFHSATLVLAGAYLLLVAIVGYYVRYFGGDWGRALQLALVFLASVLLCILMFFGTLRARIRVLMRKHFFRYRYDYRDEWLRFTRTLADHNSAERLSQRLIRGLAEMVDSPAGSLWLSDSAATGYRQACAWNTPALDTFEPADSATASFLCRSGWIINLDEYRQSPERYEGVSLPEWLGAVPAAWLLVPLVIGPRMQGFIVLDHARSPIDINWEVIDLLKTAGCQAASFIGQMQATEALVEAKKFDSFNRMSAFVVHDLKNIVTQLALMLKNAERHRHNPEFQDDMLMTVNHSVEKMRQLMLQLREGESATGPSCGVNLPKIIEKIVKAKASQGREVSILAMEPLVTRGHEDKLERIIDHVTQNALDATPVGGKVAISLRREIGAVRLDVEDSGCGMSQEFIREKLFRPFQSTKKMGMGIGAYESFQYVRELGGKILVNSEVDRGTVISLLLPVFDTPDDALAG